jgi:two-component system, response regulator, stage 0 sporulation protein F
MPGNTDAIGGRAPQVPLASERRARILVADDDDEMRRLIADSLRKDNYEIIEESDGGRVLARFAAMHAFRRPADPLDLIVSDIRMPVCSGLEILRGLRDASDEIPVILVTAFGDDETRQRVHKLGGMLFDKPFGMDLLRRAVRGS